MKLARFCSALVARAFRANPSEQRSFGAIPPSEPIRSVSARWVAASLAILMALVHSARADGMAPPQGNMGVQLGYWTFSDTNWLSDYNYSPVSFTNIANVPGGDGNTLLLNSTNPAWLIYNVIENDNTTNITLDYGSLTFWFSPQWSSTNAGGTGPGCWAPLIQVGQYTTNAGYGVWSLTIDPEGTNIGFFAQDGNGLEANFLTAPVCWTNGDWHYIALSYSHTNSTLYIDGLLATNGSPVTCLPGPDVVAEGFCVGSSPGGTNQARGRFDDLSTYNYPIGAWEVAGDYEVWGIVYYGGPKLLSMDLITSAPSTYVLTPTFQAVVGFGNLTNLQVGTNCGNNTNVWFANTAANVVGAGSNATVSLSFTINGGISGALYDVFANASLTRSSPSYAWAWMGQGPACGSRYTLTNLPMGSVYLILGLPIDSDGDGLTDAYEQLVSHTDPNNPDTYGSGLLDGWYVAFGLSSSTDPYAECPCGNGWTILQACQNGWNPSDTSNCSTPPTPSGLTIRYYGPSTNVTVAWNPAPFATSYTVQRYIPALDQTNTFTFSNATAFLDVLPVGSIPTDPFAALPTYAVMTEYSGGASPWSATVPIYNCVAYDYGSFCEYGPWYNANIYSYPSAIAAHVVRGPQGHLFLATSALPADAATLRISVIPTTAGYYDPALYPAWYPANYAAEDPMLFAPNPSVANFDVSATCLQNGVYEFTTDQVPPFGAYNFSVQAIRADQSLGDEVLIPNFAREIDPTDDTWGIQTGAAPFLDGRQQIQQNIEFQLRAAEGANTCDGSYLPFSIGGCNWNTAQNQSVIETGYTSYVFAGFHYVFPGFYFWDTDTNQDRLNLDVLRPFEQNFGYANLLFADTNIDSYGEMTNFCWETYPSWYFELTWGTNPNYPTAHSTSLFSTHDYLSGNTTNSIAGILTTNATRWIVAARWYPTYLGHPCDFGDWVVSDYVNMYGLALQSILWPTNADPVQYTVLTPGQTAPPLGNGYWYSDYFIEMARPQLATLSYYFARPSTLAWINPNFDPRPGEPAFTPAAATPTMITSFGQPFFITAWAKQAILNGRASISKAVFSGFTNAYAFPEQYFTNALLIGSDGVVTTNSAGILSPYGELLPTMPGQAALVTMPDAATGSQGTGVVNVIKLQLDVNHDGNMDLSFGGPDNTSLARPYQFWVNNDFDRPWPDADDGVPYDDSITATQAKYVPDCNYTNNAGARAIPTMRDLEDFARLWVCGVTTNLLAALPPGTTVTLDWGDVGSPNTNNPTIDLFPAADLDGGIGYLTNSGSAVLQFAQSLYPCVQRLGPGQQIQLNSPRFADSWAGNYFIWCGVTKGVGALRLTLSQGGTNMLAQTAAYIQLVDVKQMYERWTAGDKALTMPRTNALPAGEDLPPLTPSFQYPPLSPTNTPYILYVHGWNMDRYDKDRFAERAFKRLYWQGYQGRFGIFRWPTDYDFHGGLIDALFQPHNYDDSESTAWHSAATLLNKLKDLNADYPGQVYLLAHSMGNVVAGEALRLARTNVIVNSYIASQGAIPAHVYDASVTNLIDFTHTSTKIPDWLHWQTLASYGPTTPNIYGSRMVTNSAAVGRRVNFCNANDYALSPDAWCFNQELKPDTGIGYSYGYLGSTNDPPPWNNFFYSSTARSVTFDIINRQQDLYTVMAYAAESRSKALGATTNVGGLTGNVDLQQVWQDDPSGNQFRDHFWHSAQFRGDNWQQMSYWNALLGVTGFSLRNP